MQLVYDIVLVLWVESPSFNTLPSRAARGRLGLHHQESPHRKLPSADLLPRDRVPTRGLQTDRAGPRKQLDPDMATAPKFVIHASGVTVATSIDHHLARTHGVHMPKRFWRCQYCVATMSGIEIREHGCGGGTAGRRARPRPQNQSATCVEHPSAPAASAQQEHGSGHSTRADDAETKREARGLRQQAAPIGGRTRARSERVISVDPSPPPPPPPTGCPDEFYIQQPPPRKPDASGVNQTRSTALSAPE